MTRRPRVLIADDHAATRAGVRMALERGGCDVCAEASNAGDAVRAALRERPDVCVVDLDMPGDGLRAVAGITGHLPETPVLVLTVSSRTDDLFGAIRAGAAGYLLKDMDPARLAVAVHDALAGEATLPGALTTHLIEEFRHRSGAGRTLMLDQSHRVTLTQREWDVLDLLQEGRSTAEIAGRLFLSQVTVRRHISTLLHKLGVTTREEALRVAAQNNPGRFRRSST
jgi:two-component system, NarL family, nitrate/nitrite response regulator NarL